MISNSSASLCWYSGAGGQVRVKRSVSLPMSSIAFTSSIVFAFVALVSLRVASNSANIYLIFNHQTEISDLPTVLTNECAMQSVRVQWLGDSIPLCPQTHDQFQVCLHDIILQHAATV